jgi:hypothetical protein
MFFLQENSRENQLNWNSLLPCALKPKRGIPKPSGIVSLIMVSVILTALSSITSLPIVDVYADQDYDYFTIEQTLPDDLSSQGNSAIPPNGEEEQQQLVWPPFPEIIKIPLHYNQIRHYPHHYHHYLHSHYTRPSQRQ